MKKITLILLIAVISLTLAVTALAVPSWSDVDENAWYYDSIVTANEKGIMEGKPGNLFAPYDKLSRAEYVTILARLSGAEQDNNNPFTDVPKDSWYSGYVGWAVNAGIVKGFTDNTFRGAQKITRQELMVMTARYLDYEWLDLKTAENNGVEFSDYDVIADFAKASVEKMRLLGIVKGDDYSRFNPLNDATRAEAATIIVRIVGLIDTFDNSARIGNTPLEEYSLFSDVLDEAELVKIVGNINAMTGCNLVISGKLDGKNIVFEVDESLRMLEYSIKEVNGSLYFAVSSKYAAPYFPRIVEHALSLRDHFVIRTGYEGYGSFMLDEALNENGRITYLCETNKNPLSYKIGDNVTFRISLLSGYKLVSVPQFTWQYNTDDGNEKKGTVHGISGQFVITLDSLEAPGTGHLTVKCVNRKGYPIAALSDSVLDASVVYGFNDITTYKEKPSDFESFWNNKMVVLMETDPSAISMTECPVKINGYKIYDVEVNAVNTISYFHVSIPENASPASLKIRAHFDGYGNPTSDGADLSADAISVSVNKMSIKNHQSEEYYAGQSIPDFFGNMKPDEHPFLDMIYRDVQAIRFVEKQFADLWNGRDMITSGGSMGGFQSIAVAALYNKVTECVPAIPWMCDIGGHSQGGRLLGWLPEYNDGNKYFDSTYLASMFKGTVRINAGLGDYTCPPTGVVALYNAFECDKSIMFTQCMGHGSNNQSPDNKSYTLSAMDPVIDTMDLTITDNGFAGTLPNYNSDRVLNAVEERMKAIADPYTKVSNKVSFAFSSELTKEAFSEIIESNLTENYGLDPSFNIKIDDDYLGMIASEFSSQGQGATKIVNFEYVIYDDDGNYYDATTLFMIKKNIS